ncbi:MAG: LacI family DNA-binding transcriptional regulator [Chloroflexota bacterium]|nr:LacI family DNA-binding transcriptional regulator [Chloroflexota bacterium]
MPYSNDLTIIDIAKLSGVSISTVSRILNGREEVAPATRARVQRIIDEVGYQPHAQAQHLRARRAMMIALLYPPPTQTDYVMTQFVLDFMIGASQRAGQNRYLFSFITQPLDPSSLLNLYRSGQIDGAILMQVRLQDWRVDLLRHEDYPFVLIGRCADNDGISYIDLDFEAAVLSAYDKLVELGHQQIGLITFPRRTHDEEYGPAVRSIQGFEAACAKHGLTPILYEAEFGMEPMFAALECLARQYPDLTAIVTSHSESISAILQAADALGLQIPHDLSVIAPLEDTLAERSTPPLTTIDFPSYDMGQQGVDMLLHKLEHPQAAPQQILIAPRLVMRESVRAHKPLS